MAGAAIIGAGVAIALAGAAAAGIWRVGARSQSPKRKEVTGIVDSRLIVDDVAFESAGSKLAGWLIRLPSADADRPLPVVIVAHGWGSNRSRVLRYAKPLYEAGYGVFLYDARSHGDSEDIKAPSALMFRDDVLAAVQAVSTLPGIDRDRIVVLGHSLGGFGAVLSLAQGMKVRAVVTDSMPVHFDTMVRSQLKAKGLPFFPLGYFIPAIWLLRAKIPRAVVREANVPDILRQYAGASEAAALHKTPVYMVHSLGDSFIPAQDLQKLKDTLAPGTIDTLFVQSDGHSASEQDPKFWEHVLPFIERSMK
ncbi:alpha/beta hydrolase [Paenibacillus sp. NPDC058174]|uniref:alpha/beta hydrolase n=1 Tax=Paenibacillus sp. NPDC058174 TaxID=3346366 RepID=UPI0036D8E65A